MHDFPSHFYTMNFRFFSFLLLIKTMGWSAVAPAGAINIDTGRQLFVDDFLIAETTLKRTFHSAEVQGEAPVLQPETPLEKNDARGRDAIPVAAPFGDGAWFDSQDGLFKLWYHAGWFDGNAYATSRDGIHWQRPLLDVVPGTNRVLPIREVDGHRLMRDGTSVWHDQATSNPAEAWKMFVYSRQEGSTAEGSAKGELMTSPDGVHWNPLRPVTFSHGDNSSIFYDPFRKLWIFSVRDSTYSLRDPTVKVRARFYQAAREFDKLADRKNNDRPPFWLKLDGRDKPDPELGYEPELYHFTATPYESLMVGIFGLFYGPPNDVCFKTKRPKIIDLQVGFSRDGLVYDRPNREAFLRSSRTPGAWNRGYLHPATGGCLIVGDKLYFYFGAWSGVAGDHGHVYAGGSTGLATLRRDGFASLDAGGQPGMLTTVPVVFKGKVPFVNVASGSGALRAEILDSSGQPRAPFTLENSIAVRTDSTRQRLEWKGSVDLEGLIGKPVRFRFHLTEGQLYSFWVSKDGSGSSHGYVAAGGPGFLGPTDEVGGGKK
ncbi:MAG: hypothetical protein JWO94_2752 [Verrucomicrobiaceae bacterium]|nr:hypothetical protein [Verrucomicrobiaceae bacterium]